MTPQEWETACVGLAEADPVMASLIERFAGSRLVTRGQPFETLLRAIVGQQISLKAADAIWGRLSAVVHCDSPASLLTASSDSLRQVGLSARKVGYVQDLARHFADGRIDPQGFQRLGDEDITRALVAVRGIGRWTAEMFLIFHLARPGGWAVHDIGLQRAVSELYLDGLRPTPAALREVGERWRPWRSVASWYLWRHVEPVEVVY
ncbi:MAG: DNA-3-methyladenine glycosylase 2 family protein [Pseudogulbenkiania sp.]|nr:DNA-3-methyladenine glycosylase 2 family protein [Pseudogulbenkiania sp.]